MKENFIHRLMQKASREDRIAVEAASKTEFIHLNTGMTKEEWQEAFGDLDSNTVAKLSVLAGKEPPRTPEGWRKLAEESKKNSERFRTQGKKEEPKNNI